MTGNFKDGQLSNLFIEGNGESLYYALEGDTLTQGINRILSATIGLSFVDGLIKKSNFGIRPDGKFIPVQDINEKMSRLEGFKWRVEEKPLRATIDTWRKVIEIDPTLPNFFNKPEVKLTMPTQGQLQKALQEKPVKSAGGG
jgi:hypothetical protein